MNKHLQDYFNAAKQQQPALSNSELKQLIEQARFAKPKFRFSTIWLVGFVTMGCLLAGLWWALQPSPIANQKISAKPKAPKTTTIPQQSPVLSMDEQVPQKIAGTSKHPLFNQSPKANLAYANLPLVFSEPTSNITYTPQTLESEAYMSPEGYLILSPLELAELGIITDGNELSYLNIVDSTTIWKSQLDTVQFYSFSIRADKQGRKHISHGPRSLLKLADSKKCWPAFITVISSNDSVNTAAEYISDYKLEQDFCKDAYPYAVPVFVETQAIPGKYSTNNAFIFWFKAQESFYQALPKAIRSEVREKYPPTNMNDYKQLLSKYSFLAIQSQFAQQLDSNTINSLTSHYIQPNNEQLKALHIHLKKPGFNFRNSVLIAGKTHEIRIRQKGVELLVQSNQPFRKRHRISKSQLKFMPVALTSSNLDYIKYLYPLTDSISYSKQQAINLQTFISSSGNLIPLRIGPSYVLWFEPHEDLLNILKLPPKNNK